MGEIGVLGLMLIATIAGRVLRAVVASRAGRRRRRLRGGKGGLWGLIVVIVGIVHRCLPGQVRILVGGRDVGLIGGVGRESGLWGLVGLWIILRLRRLLRLLILSRIVARVDRCRGLVLMLIARQPDALSVASVRDRGLNAHGLRTTTVMCLATRSSIWGVSRCPPRLILLLTESMRVVSCIKAGRPSKVGIVVGGLGAIGVLGTIVGLRWMVVGRVVRLAILGVCHCQRLNLLPE